MPDSIRRLLLLGALLLLVFAAGVLLPWDAELATASAIAGGSRTGTHFELVLFGDSCDAECLSSDAPPQVVYRVPAGTEVWITDVDATSGGFVLWRGAPQLREQVGFIVDRAGIGLGQSSRTYATPIRFGPGDEILVGPAGKDVEWAALRGFVTPVGKTVAGR